MHCSNTRFKPLRLKHVMRSEMSHLRTTRSSVFTTALTYTKMAGLFDVLKINSVVWLLIESNKFVLIFSKEKRSVHHFITGYYGYGYCIWKRKKLKSNPEIFELTSVLNIALHGYASYNSVLIR